MKATLFYLGAAVLFVSLLAPASSAAAFTASDHTRTLSGKVLGRQDNPMTKAIVYLKNTRSLAVTTYITDPDGSYRFSALSPNVDYEVYAEYNGARSDTKTLSAFDTRDQATIVLRIK
jgi:protocatechuate 3,4-dioxygenase beta subunit